MTVRWDKRETTQRRTEAMVECGIDDTVTDKQTKQVQQQSKGGRDGLKSGGGLMGEDSRSVEGQVKGRQQG